MNSNVHPLIVVLVLALTGIAIATWMWGSGEAANIGGPSELKVDAAGHVYIQIQNSIVEHDSNGLYLKTHDLADTGVDSFLGSFAFFSNGDILLRRGPDPRTVADDVRAYQRLTNTQSIEPESPDSGMFRCQLQTKYCERFGEAGIDFKAAHGIFIDWKTDEVYISDTTRHVLRKYSSDGTVLAGPASGFKFPNQLLMHDGKLFVADTNHHEIRIVDPATETFAAELGRNSVAPALAITAEQTWPSHFVRVGDLWWVNNMRTGMNYGDIYVFDDNWRLNRRLDLPEGADPIAMVVVGNEVWVSDWYNDIVRRFSNSGEPLADLESRGLEDILKVSRTERWKFEVISYSGIALILLILAGLGVRGFAVSMSRDSAKAGLADDIDEAAPSDAFLYLEPDNKMLGRLGIVLRLFVLMMIVLAALIAYLIVFHSKPEVGFAFVLPGLRFSGK